MPDEKPDMRPGGESQSAERAASAEVNGRRVNEAIERGAAGAGTAVFVCECGRIGCSETVSLSIAEYEAVRSGFERFLVVPGHEMEDIEDVVERHDSYLVVVKRDRIAAEIAYSGDERDDT